MSDVPRAKTWLAQAANDSAHARYAMAGGFYAQSCYAGQQAVEKALKALLLYSGHDIGRTHSIVSLRRALTEAGVELPESVISLSDAQDLTRLNIETRYPLGDGDEPPFELFGQEQANRVVAIAERVVDTVQGVLADL